MRRRPLASSERRNSLQSERCRPIGTDMCPASTPETDRARTSSPRLAFVASTGRTATMCLATTLNALPAVRAYHEGHDPDEERTPRLPLINLQNRLAWSTVTDAREVVRERRSPSALLAAAGDASLLVDVAFYNSPLLPQLAELYPSAPMLAIVRRCESFVRSATIMNGEDPQPAGWPDPAKELTNRERFIELGRLRPLEGTPEAEQWPDWSGIQRNVWLWYAVCSLPYFTAILINLLGLGQQNIYFALT